MANRDPIFERRLRRADFLKLTVAGGAAGLLAACGGGSETAAKPAEPTATAGVATGPATTAPPATTARPPIESEPGGLRIIEYGGYEVPELWKPYSEKFPNEKPSFKLIGSDDEATTALGAGGTANFDLGHPCVGVIQDWIAMDAVQPWDTSLISNFPDLNPALVAAGQVDGQQYFIPLDWGFISALYNADKVDPGEESWALFFDDRYQGRIAWYDSSQDMMAITGYYLGFANPFDMSEKEIEEATQFLIDKKKNVRFIWSAQSDMESQFAQGDIWITYSWPSTWVAMQKQGLNVGYLSPKEGRLAFLCGLMLIKDTENYRHAHEYANAWASPETGLWLLNNYAYGHSNTKIDLTQVDPALVEAFSLKDPAAIGEPAVHVLRFIPKRAAYTKAWSAVKAA